MYLNGLTHRRVSASAGGAGKKSTRGSVIFGEASSAQSWRRPWAAWRLPHGVARGKARGDLAPKIKRGQHCLVAASK